VQAFRPARSDAVDLT